MADFLIRNIDVPLAERIKSFAREKGWPLNDVILHLLNQSLDTTAAISSADMTAATSSARESDDLALLTGHFADDEKHAFEAAVKAIASMPDDIALYEATRANLRRAAA